MRRTLLAALAIAVIAVLGWLDYLSGPDLGFSLFYLIPIVLCGWFLGTAAGIATAVAAAIAWVWADVSWHSAAPGISLWNGFTRLVIYVTQGWMMARLRRDREELKVRIGHEARLARTDVATSLPNVRAFVEQADSYLREARANGWPVCLLYIDLDDFKSINDRFGHERGNELLRGVGSVILASVRGNDLPARMGGDEFAVLLQNVDRVASERIARRIHDHIAEVGPDTGLNCTIGAAYFTVPPESAAELVAIADRTMYAAKEAGKRRVVIREAG